MGAHVKPDRCGDNGGAHFIITCLDSKHGNIDRSSSSSPVVVKVDKNSASPIHSNPMEDHYLLLPPPTFASSLPPPPPSRTIEEDVAATVNLISSDSRIVFRLLSLFFIGLISIWANFEATKGFDITIVNDAGDAAVGRKFDLFYGSNDGATRMVLSASEFVEKLLYYNPGNTLPRKDVNHVIVRLASRNLTHMAMVSSRGKGEFTIDISLWVMQGRKRNVDNKMAAAVQRGMARIWLWDGEDGAPPALLEGMVEYISDLAGFSQAKPNSVLDLSSGYEDLWWTKKDPRAVAEFLKYCEAQKRGFIQRLNQAMRHRWHEGEALEDAAFQDLCSSYDSSTQISLVSDH